MQRLTTIFAIFPICFAVGCSAPIASSPRVARIDMAPTAPTSWNKRDGLLAAGVVANDCVSRKWVTDFVAKTGRQPRIRVVPLRNTTGAAINANVYAQKIQSAFLRTGKVRIATASSDVSAELRDQRRHASDASMKRNNRGRADFLLTGWIYSKPGAFMTVLELIDVETNEKIWMTMHRSDK